MDLGKYELRGLLLAAIKSEVESKNVYLKLKDRVDNILLKERFEFLAGEEQKHKEYIEKIYKRKMGEDVPELPEKTIVPLPEIKADDDMPISEILQGAMDAELAARDFYLSLSDRFNDEPEVRKMLQIFADMELGHYRLLELEKQIAEKFEDYEAFSPDIHLGP